MVKTPTLLYICDVDRAIYYRERERVLRWKESSCNGVMIWNHGWQLRRCYRSSWTAYYSQRRRQANEVAKTAGKASLEVFMGNGDLRSTCTKAMEQQRDAKAVQ
ncbi:hypothetical protein HanIR_Chr06g0297171 [Helianthus annuus]|nr:hypothetical protein HanIR_Chr06g0297171 [Helianthus annuus]